MTGVGSWRKEEIPDTGRMAFGFATVSAKRLVFLLIRDHFPEDKFSIGLLVKVGEGVVNDVPFIEGAGVISPILVAEEIAKSMEGTRSGGEEQDIELDLTLLLSLDLTCKLSLV